MPMVEHYRYYAMGPRARLGTPSTIGYSQHWLVRMIYPFSFVTTATGKQGRVRSGATIQDEWTSGYILSPLAGDDDDRGWTGGGGGDPT